MNGTKLVSEMSLKKLAGKLSTENFLAMVMVNTVTNTRLSSRVNPDISPRRSTLFLSKLINQSS